MCVVGIVAQQFLTLPWHNQLVEELLNWLHLPLFTVVSILFLRLPIWKSAIWPLTLLVALAAGTELIQLINDRNASLVDWLVDSLGIAVGYSIVHPMRPRLLLVALTGACVVATAPLCLALAAFIHRNVAFPSLFHPEEKLSRYLTTVVAQSDYIETVQHPSRSGLVVLMLDIGAKQRWPGIRFNEVVDNWEGFSSVGFEFYNPDQMVKKVYVTTRTKAERRDAASGLIYAVNIEPGYQTARVPIREIAKVDEAGATQVARLVLYSSGSSARGKLGIGRVRLEP